MLAKPLRILLLEDSPTDADLMIRELRRAGFEPQWKRVETETAFLAELDSQLDLVLSDYSLPQFDGLRALELLRSRGLETPFILVSGSLGEERAVEAMRRGASDYLLKDRIKRLGVAVDRALKEHRRRQEHHHADEALRALQALHELILNSAGKGILGVDQDRRIIFENSVAGRLLGRQPGELIGQLIHEAVHLGERKPSSCQRGDCPLLATLRNGCQRQSEEEVFWRKDGTSLPVECSSDPIRDKAGTIIGAVLVFSDISERRQLEEQLRQAQKMEAVGQLAGGVAHDFNNILATMILQIEQAELIEDLPAEMRQGLVELHAGAERATNLTRQLLLFSRRQSMQPLVLDLNQAVANLARMLERVIGEDVSIEIRLHADPLVVLGDPGMLDQVLMNLVVNARDAMPGGGSLRIDTAKCVTGPPDALGPAEKVAGAYARLSVTDTGCGIPRELLPRIFEPFFTTKEPGKGTGLGLATVFGIVKQHRGLIKVVSQPGQGATFHVYLPLSDATPEILVAEASQRRLGRGETVLLVEDDPALRALTRISLEQNQYRVLEAADGVQARNQWQQHQAEIDLLLTDVVMPGGMSGWELAEALQREQPAIKVIYTSGYNAETASGGRRLDQEQVFLQKPYTLHSLLGTLRRCLDGG